MKTCRISKRIKKNKTRCSLYKENYSCPPLPLCNIAMMEYQKAERTQCTAQPKCSHDKEQRSCKTFTELSMCLSWGLHSKVKSNFLGSREQSVLSMHAMCISVYICVCFTFTNLQALRKLLLAFRLTPRECAQPLHTYTVQNPSFFLSFLQFTDYYQSTFIPSCHDSKSPMALQGLEGQV